MTPQLELRNVAVAYDGVPVVSGVSLRLARGAIGCLLGPSGGGKTSLLRAIAGFEPAVVGEIALAGTVVSRAHWTLPPELRNVGMVFQDFALFPHLSVHDNIGFGLRKWRAAEREARITELLALIGLPGAASAYPHQLSGGMQQRVALARAMAPRPSILLLDEPFSSIDTDLREQLAQEVRAMLVQSGMTAILVTHDQTEAFAMAVRDGFPSRKIPRPSRTAHGRIRTRGRPGIVHAHRYRQESGKRRRNRRLKSWLGSDGEPHRAAPSCACLA